MKVLRRIMTPRADGALLVPEAVLQSFKDTHNGGRESVLKMWEASGFNKDVVNLCWSNGDVFMS